MRCFVGMDGWGALFRGFTLCARGTQCGVPLLLDRIKQSMVSCKVSGHSLCPEPRWAPKRDVVAEDVHRAAFRKRQHS